MFLFLVLLAFTLLYVYSRIRHSYWKKRGVPSAEPTLFFGNIAKFVLGRENIAASFDRVYKLYPNERYVGLYEMFKPNLIIMDPQLIGDVMIKDFSKFHDRITKAAKNSDPLSNNLLNLTGNDWKIVRSKMVPTFSSAKMKSMHGLVMECTEILDQYLKVYTKTGDPVDVKEVMARFTTDVIGRCAFGLDFNSITDPDSEYRKVGKQIFTQTRKDVVKLFLRLLHPKMLNWLGIRGISENIEKFFFKLLHDTMEYRKTEGVRRNDVLQLLVNVRDQELAELEKSNANGEKKVAFFNDNLLAANMFVFFLAGFETTASTLGYLLYELSLNPEIQERLRDEIKAVYEAHDRKLDYDNLNELPYMEMVITETLRKYDPAPVTGRVCTEVYQIPGTDLVLEPGTRITIPIYSIHHDERYYPNPDKFDPERFTQENIDKRPPHTFLAFGDGPRICIGLRFAKVEMKSCLAKILLNYKFSTCKKTEIPIQIKPRSVLFSAKNEIYLNVSEL